MTLASRIREKSDQTGAVSNPVTGRWFAIKFIPDLFAADNISIGVALINSEGIIRTRFAENYSRLRCFYDDSLNIADVEFLAELLEEGLSGLHESEFSKRNFGPSVSFTQPTYAAGRTETDIIDSLFRTAVPIARPRQDAGGKKQRIRFESESTIRSRIGKCLHERYKNVAPNFHAQGRYYAIDEQQHKLKLHLRNEGKAAGYVASALIADPVNAELRVLRGVDALRTLKHIVPEERCGLFVIRPGGRHGVQEQTLTRMDDLMEGLRWRLENDGIDLRDADAPDLMADQIADWYLEVA